MIIPQMSQLTLWDHICLDHLYASQQVPHAHTEPPPSMTSGKVV